MVKRFISNNLVYEVLVDFLPAFGELRALQKMVLDQQEQIDYLKVKLNLACVVPPRS